LEASDLDALVRGGCGHLEVLHCGFQWSCDALAGDDGGWSICESLSFSLLRLCSVVLGLEKWEDVV
jgi:hypothetical protein